MPKNGKISQKIAKNGQKMPKMAKNRKKSQKMVKKCQKCPKCLKIAKNAQKMPKMLKLHIHLLFCKVLECSVNSNKKNRTFCKIISKKKKISIGNDIPLRAVTQFGGCVWKSDNNANLMLGACFERSEKLRQTQGLALLSSVLKTMHNALSHFHWKIA